MQSYLKTKNTLTFLSLNKSPIEQFHSASGHNTVFKLDNNILTFYLTLSLYAHYWILGSISSLANYLNSWY